jgi:hypothetical protein
VILEGDDQQWNEAEKEIEGDAYVHFINLPNELIHTSPQPRPCKYGRDKQF